jgi:hypothetical protein
MEIKVMKKLVLGILTLVSLEAKAQQEVLDKDDFFGGRQVINVDSIKNEDLVENYRYTWYTVPSYISQDEKIELSGIEMRRYYKNYSNGMAMGIIGAGAITLGMNMINNSTYMKTTSYRPNPWSDIITTTEVSTNKSKLAMGKALTVVGGLSSLVGTILVIEAPCHIKNAGLILSGNGGGLIIKI